MTNDTATYRAVQAVAPGQLELTTKPLREPAMSASVSRLVGSVIATSRRSPACSRSPGHVCPAMR
jgi:hypothetical protein